MHPAPGLDRMSNFPSKSQARFAIFFNSNTFLVKDVSNPTPLFNHAADERKIHLFSVFFPWFKYMENAYLLIDYNRC
jgi:hypothetical protein